MIATSHPEQEAGIMRKAVGQSVYGWRRRQADPKETATYFWITHYATNLIQRFQRHFGVCMQKPENITVGGFGSNIHLSRAAALTAADNLIAEIFSQSVGAVSARAIDDNDFRPAGSPPQIRQKGAYRRRLIKDRNNDRHLHLRFLYELLFVR
jgi:hypothetical protein